MSVEWLQDLEEKVQEATKLLAELRKDNARLQARVEELEARDGDEEGWNKERAEIEQRVTDLARHLEQLLAE